MSCYLWSKSKDLIPKQNEFKERLIKLLLMCMVTIVYIYQLSLSVIVMIIVCSCDVIFLEKLNISFVIY